MDTEEEFIACPSSKIDSEGARIFGVVLGEVDAPIVSYLEKNVQVDDALLESLGDVSPTRVFRITGKCVNSQCQQFVNGMCRLGKDVLSNLPKATEEIPACTIRADCRWYKENGKEVCFRCAHVVTTTLINDRLMGGISTPDKVAK